MIRDLSLLSAASILADNVLVAVGCERMTFTLPMVLTFNELGRFYLPLSAAAVTSLLISLNRSK